MEIYNTKTKQNACRVEFNEQSGAICIGMVFGLLLSRKTHLAQVVWHNFVEDEETCVLTRQAISGGFDSEYGLDNLFRN